MYQFETLKKAILFNTVEVLPSDHEQLDKEIHRLVDLANQSGQKIIHYVGFEISGQIHIGTGLSMALKIKQLQDAGVVCTFWLADYHTWLNKKLDGHMKTIRTIARTYFAPVMLQCVQAVGGDAHAIQVLYAEDEYKKYKQLTHDNDTSFWDVELDVNSHMTLNRVLRSLSIAGKTVGTDVDYQVTRYPGMQAADVFWLGTHLIQAGTDQRKIYVTTRDIAYKVAKEYQLGFRIDDTIISVKPISMSSQLLLGLGKPTTIQSEESDIPLLEMNKMSKSKPETCIFVHDSAEEIKKKIQKGYCPIIDPELNVEQNAAEQLYNPMLDWAKHLLFPAQKIIRINRPEKFGGDIVFDTYTNLHDAYMSGSLHPLDLKNGIADTLAEWIAPISEWKSNNIEAYNLVLKASSKL